MRLKLSRLLFLSTVLCIGCGEYEILEHQKACKKSADSLYRVHKDSLNILGDSLCKLKYQNYYDKALDSLKIARLKDIKQLID